MAQGSFDPAVGGFPRPTGASGAEKSDMRHEGQERIAEKEGSGPTAVQEEGTDGNCEGASVTTRQAENQTSPADSTQCSGSPVCEVTDPPPSHIEPVTVTRPATGTTTLSPTAPGFVPATALGAVSPRQQQCQQQQAEEQVCTDLQRLSLASASSEQAGSGPHVDSSLDRTRDGTIPRPRPLPLTLSPLSRSRVQGLETQGLWPPAPSQLAAPQSQVMSRTSDASSWPPMSIGSHSGLPNVPSCEVTSTCYTARAFLIENVPVGINYLSLAALLDRKEFPTMRPPNLDCLPTHGTIELSFSDLRDARAAVAKIRRCQPSWGIRSLPDRADTGRLIICALKHGGLTSQSLVARPQQPITHQASGTKHLNHAIREVVELFGTVRSLCTISYCPSVTIGTPVQVEAALLVEFFDARCAESCARYIQGVTLKDCYLEVQACQAMREEDLSTNRHQLSQPHSQQQLPSQSQQQGLSASKPASAAPDLLRAAMQLPPSIGLGFGGPNDGCGKPGVTAAQTDQFNDPERPVGTSAILPTLTSPWERGHHAQQASDGSVASVITAGTGLTADSSSSYDAGLLSHRVGNSSRFADEGRSVSVDHADVAYSLPPAKAAAHAASINGLALGTQLVKLSPTGRTTVPVGQEHDVWLNSSPTKLHDLTTRHSGLTGGLGALPSGSRLPIIGSSTGSDASDALHSLRTGTSALPSMPFADRRRDTVFAQPGGPHQTSTSNVSHISPPFLNAACPPFTPQSQCVVTNGGVSTQVAHCGLSGLRYSEMLGHARDTFGTSEGPGSNQQENHQQINLSTNPQQHYSRHEMSSGPGLNTMVNGHGHGRLVGHHRGGSNSGNNQNHVDIEKIKRGQDVRTTIMLRNIPNKIDQTMLKEIVDETSFGKYDFMYLRIDFANNCNVGYAFINFEDPIDIIDFAKARAGKTWNCFNSDKIAEISYATIQGKDCLVQKFRNSSVMLEHPSFRPKIFHTGAGPLASTEDTFPPPDNPSKMRRSVENAEHVGLFAPRVGQQYRDEQRRRRSQYDRGTTAAEREIYPVLHANAVAAGSVPMTVAAMPMKRLGNAVATNLAESDNSSSCPWTPQSRHGAHSSSTGPSSSSSAVTFSPHRRGNALSTGGTMASISEMHIGIGTGSPPSYAVNESAGLSMSPTLLSPSAKAIGATLGGGVPLGPAAPAADRPAVWSDRW